VNAVSIATIPPIDVIGCFARTASVVNHPEEQRGEGVESEGAGDRARSGDESRVMKAKMPPCSSIAARLTPAGPRHI